MGAGHVRVTAEYGTATLWLDFPGEPVNVLDRTRLADLGAALAAVAADPFINLVVLRSARPAGFCSGLRPEALASLTHPTDRAAFAAFGQSVTDQLANLPQTTIAFLDGPVLGAGLELVLACDHRLVLSRITTHLGFAGAAPCLGGSARLRRLVGPRVADDLLATGRTLSGREAVRAGLADHAFCERRGKIELRTFLDTLERRGPRPRVRVELSGLAAERRAFAAAVPPTAARPVLAPTRNPIPPFPDIVGLIGDDPDAARFAAEVALRGGRVVVDGTTTGVAGGIAAAQARGFATPLEAEQATARVATGTAFDRAGLVLTTGPIPAVGRRCVVGLLMEGSVPPPGASRHVVGVRFASDEPLSSTTGSPPHPAWFAAPLSPERRGWEPTGPRIGSYGAKPTHGGDRAPLPSPLGGEGRGEPRGVRGLTTHDENRGATLYRPPTLFPSPDADPDAVAALAAWLAAFDRPPQVVASSPPAARAAA
jgi:enoyl-CoA hydratase/carnithine racemase